MIQVILVEPSKPANIGMVARAMNNMGFDHLILINPCDHKNEKAIATAVHSTKQLDNLVIFDNLEEALKETTINIATTRRMRHVNDTLETLWNLEGIVGDLTANISIVFGRENNGLSNDEIVQCNHFMHIPTFGDSGSINLAQSVMLTLYELSKIKYRSADIKKDSGQIKTTNAVNQDKAQPAKVNSVRDHALKTLQLAGYASGYNQAFVKQSLTEFLNRMPLNDKDTRVLHKMLQALDLSLAK